MDLFSTYRSSLGRLIDHEVRDFLEIPEGTELTADLCREHWEALPDNSPKLRAFAKRFQLVVPKAQPSSLKALLNRESKRKVRMIRRSTLPRMPHFANLVDPGELPNPAFLHAYRHYAEAPIASSKAPVAHQLLIKDSAKAFSEHLRCLVSIPVDLRANVPKTKSLMEVTAKKLQSSKVKLLREIGLDAVLRDQDGNTLLMRRLKMPGSNPKAVARLSKVLSPDPSEPHTDPNPLNNQGHSILDCALRVGRTDELPFGIHRLKEACRRLHLWALITHDWPEATLSMEGLSALTSGILAYIARPAVAKRIVNKGFNPHLNRWPIARGQMLEICNFQPSRHEELEDLSLTVADFARRSGTADLLLLLLSRNALPKGSSWYKGSRVPENPNREAFWREYLQRLAVILEPLIGEIHSPSAICEEGHNAYCHLKKLRQRHEVGFKPLLPLFRELRARQVSPCEQPECRTRPFYDKIQRKLETARRYLLYRHWQLDFRTD